MHNTPAQPPHPHQNEALDRVFAFVNGSYWYKDKKLMQLLIEVKNDPKYCTHTSASHQRIEQVIEELQKLAYAELEAKRVPHLCNEAWMGHTYANSAYLKAIALLQAGQK